MLRNIQTVEQFGLNAEGKHQELALDYDRCVLTLTVTGREFEPRHSRANAVRLELFLDTIDQKVVV